MAEDVPSLTLPARRGGFLIGVVSFSHAIQHVYVAVLPLTYPLAVVEFHASYTALGILLAVTGIVGGFLQGAAGFYMRVSARMVLALQSAVNMARFGAENYVGPIVALSMLRELGPVLTAILVGGKVASGITAELGSMKVTEQIDALRALGVNYVKRLIVPRLLAALVVFPLVTILADAIGLFGGMLVVVFDRAVDGYLYWNTISYWVVMRDFLTGIAKSVVFGALVTLIGCYNGLGTEGGTEGLGRSTTDTVVQVAMAVIISDFFLTKLFFILFW